jgi:hypothetical protein
MRYIKYIGDTCEGSFYAGEILKATDADAAELVRSGAYRYATLEEWMLQNETGPIDRIITIVLCAAILTVFVMAWPNFSHFRGW